jgi:hypothetical protein
VLIMVVDDTAMNPEVTHPYYPVDIEISGYVANEWPFLTLLVILGSACAFILALARGVTRYLRPDLPRSEVLTVLWFILCEHQWLPRCISMKLIQISGASLHLFFECMLMQIGFKEATDEAIAYYVRNWRSLAGQQGLFGQLWKEYAYSDSRYLTQDASLLCLEAITVVCLLTPRSSTTLIILLSRCSGVHCRCSWHTWSYQRIPCATAFRLSYLRLTCMVLSSIMQLAWRSCGSSIYRTLDPKPCTFGSTLLALMRHGLLFLLCSFGTR